MSDNPHFYLFLLSLLHPHVPTVRDIPCKEENEQSTQLIGSSRIGISLAAIKGILILIMVSLLLTFLPNSIPKKKQSWRPQLQEQEEG